MSGPTCRCSFATRPEAPVVIGGLSTKMTVLYDHYSSRTRRSYEGFRILEDMRTLVLRGVS